VKYRSDETEAAAVTIPRVRFTVRRMMVAVAIVAATLAVGVLAMRPDVSPRRLAVVNRSGRPIPRLDFTVSGETVTLRSIPAGATVTAFYPSRRDQFDQFAVTGSLADGYRLDAGFGFRVTSERPRGYPVFIVGQDDRMMISEGGGSP
jgi:hypothetical protein